MEWFQIACSDEHLTLDVAPPGGEAWKVDIPWESIERVCLELGDFLSSDTIYIFVEGREESYMIPTEGAGGDELVGQLLDRGLVDAEEWIEMMTSAEGFRCWPPPDAADLEKPG